MAENRSPWIESLVRTRKPKMLKGVLSADVAIVGGGIAGASTLFYILEHTNATAALLEASLVGHGATGHNAGHVVAGFEEAASVRVEKFGLEKALEAERMMDEGWLLLDEIYRVTGIKGRQAPFLAYGAYSKLDLIVSNIESYCYYYDLAGIPYESFLIAEGTGVYEKIPDRLKKYARVIPHKEVLELLETSDSRYVAAMPHRTSLANSAQLSEDIISFCLKKYPERCFVHEHSPAHEILLGKSDARILGKGFVLKAKEVVLCTNGFSHFKVVNLAGPEINTALHHNVRGFVDFMAGYMENSDKLFVSHWYHEPNPAHMPGVSDESVYFYLSRRAWDKKSLLAIGGPEKEVPHHMYNRREPIGEDIVSEFDKFIKRTMDPKRTLSPRYFWHGLMGYTPSGVRLIGREPKNPILMYNLGCNGIGILPSIVGALKIARHVNREPMEETIFDPRPH